MKTTSGIGIADVTALYDGAQGDLFELVMGEQIHLGGFDSSLALAEAAGIGPGQTGVDLCCCNGAGMRFLVRFRGVASMTGVDLSRTVVERGQRRCREEGSSARIRFVLADACESGLPEGSADFVWSEDAWVYVPDKPKLIAEAARIVKAGGTIAFTDWVEGPEGMDETEADPLLQALRFPNIQDIEGYRVLLEKSGCVVLTAEDTGLFAPFMDLNLKLIETQLKYDVLRVLRFDTDALAAVTAGFKGLRDFARAGKIAQGRFIARRG